MVGVFFLSFNIIFYFFPSAFLFVCFLLILSLYFNYVFFHITLSLLFLSLGPWGIEYPNFIPCRVLSTIEIFWKSHRGVVPNVLDCKQVLTLVGLLRSLSDEYSWNRYEIMIFPSYGLNNITPVFL